MKKKLGFVMVLLLLIGVYAVYAQTGARIVESSGNFSFQPPLNWTVTEFPGLKYRVAIGPTEGGFTANITFVDETFDGNLESYVDLSIVNMETFFQGFRLLNREKFRTNSGIVGEKVIANTNQQSFFLRQIFYFLPARNNTYFVIVGSVLDRVATRYLTIFDESIKTFELVR